jgi:hypothetical protein
MMQFTVIYNLKDITNVLSYLEVNYIYKGYQALMWLAAILFRKEESDLLSLIYFGIEFQMFAWSYIKLFFMLSVCGFSK